MANNQGFQKKITFEFSVTEDHSIDLIKYKNKKHKRNLVFNIQN